MTFDSPLITVPERIGQMLIDSSEYIKEAYHWTEESLGEFKRPCFYVFPEDSSFESSQPNQDRYTQSISIAYIGEVFAGGGAYNRTQEQIARQVAHDSVIYLKRHPNLQMSNERDLFPSTLRGLNSVMWSTIDGRSAVTLYTRNATLGESGFWGFTIDMTVQLMMAYESVGL